MLRIRMAAAALNQTPYAWKNNDKNHLEAFRLAREEGASSIVIPELSATGYGCEARFFSNDLCDRAWRHLEEEILPHTAGLVTCVGLPIIYRRKRFNASAFIVNGNIQGLYVKRKLANDGLHYERRYFTPWRSGLVVPWVSPSGTTYPMGDIMFDVDGVLHAFQMCEDAWTAQGFLYRPDSIWNSSASHFAFFKDDFRTNVVLGKAQPLAAAYGYANLVGCESGRVIYDGDCMIAEGGVMVARSVRFGFRRSQVTVGTVNIDALRHLAARTTSYEAPLGDIPGLIRCTNTGGFKFPKVDNDSGTIRAAWESMKEHKKHEEFTRAAALGLFDYMRKSRAHGYVVSLSGGADSTACALLVRQMIDIAVKDLGWEGFRDALSYIPDLTETNVYSRLLTCVYQRVRGHSGLVTEEAATKVAEALGARFKVTDVTEIFLAYKKFVEDFIGRPLSPKTDRLVLQNLQARVRSPGPWGLANEGRMLYITTSNRNEAALGYATMDGDTSGGIAPLGNIDKPYLKDGWLHWMEFTGPMGFQKWPVLECVRVQKPAAELDPAEMGTTDESDLMPYLVLDAMERAAVGQSLAPTEVFEEVERRFRTHFGGMDLYRWTIKFFRLFAQNQWKRERYAPAFHYDEYNLDPKTWLRMPILSGGFEEEMDELTDWAKGQGWWEAEAA